MPNWDDPIYRVRSDRKWQAVLRARQSWYREKYLNIEAGLDMYGKERGNFLPVSAPAGLNFLNDEIARYVEEWVLISKEEGALVGEDRLLRNML